MARLSQTLSLKTEPARLHMVYQIVRRFYRPVAPPDHSGCACQNLMPAQAFGRIGDRRGWSVHFIWEYVLKRGHRYSSNPPALPGSNTNATCCARGLSQSPAAARFGIRPNHRSTGPIAACRHLPRHFILGQMPSHHNGPVN